MAASPAVLDRNQVVGPRSTNITVRRRGLFADLVGISPTMALYGAFIIVPTVFALFLSFTHWNVDGPIKWAGLANWRELFADPVSYHSLLVTFELAALSWLAPDPRRHGSRHLRRRDAALPCRLRRHLPSTPTALHGGAEPDVGGRPFPPVRRVGLARAPCPHGAS